MPQAPFKLQEYLGTPLPTLTGEMPRGIGGKNPSPKWDGKLEGISVVDDFQGKVKEYLDKSLPSQPIPAHPSHPFPSLSMVARGYSLSSDEDYLKALKTLPLESAVAVLSAWDLHEHGSSDGDERKRTISKAVEDDGHQSIAADAFEDGKSAKERVAWKFGKSPMGDTDFILVGHDEKPCMVVRCTTDAVFSEHDWNEFAVSGPFRYNPRSKASWFWSRQSNGTARLGVRFFAFTSYNKWAFGVFSPDGKFANVSPVISGNATDPSVLGALTYWARAALGHTTVDLMSSLEEVSSKPQLFPSNPARRASDNKSQRDQPDRRRVSKKANESDVEDEDVE